MTAKRLLSSLALAAVVVGALHPAPAAAVFLAADDVQDPAFRRQLEIYLGDRSERVAVEADRLRTGGQNRIGPDALSPPVRADLQARPDPFAGCGPGVVKAVRVDVTRLVATDSFVISGTTRMRLLRTGCPTVVSAVLDFKVIRRHDGGRSFDVQGYRATAQRPQ